MGTNRISFDRLTSTYTKEAFENIVTEFINMKPRQGLILFDIDNLKYINYKNSVRIGDEVITLLIAKIYSVLPKKVVFGRIIGDQFAIFISDLESAEMLENIARKIVNAPRNGLEIQGKNITATLSVGAVYIEHSEDGRGYKDIYSCVEIALCAAKDNGKNQYVIYKKSMLENSNRVYEVINELKLRIKNHSFLLEFQPLINIQEGRLAGFEVLSRMYMEQYGFIMPDEFVRLAEKNNLICDLDRVIFEMSCDVLNSLAKYGISDIPLSVNITPIYFMSPDFLKEIKECLSEKNIDTSLIAVELTENTFISSVEDAKNVVRELSQMGIEVYLDDFGSGYSNLTLVQELELSMLKMDKSLVDKVKKDDNNIIVKKTIEIADVFNMDVIAEGIETEGQLEQLKEMNCEIGQGYYLGRPMTYEKMISFIKMYNK